MKKLVKIWLKAVEDLEPTDSFEYKKDGYSYRVELKDTQKLVPNRNAYKIVWFKNGKWFKSLNIDRSSQIWTNLKNHYVA